MTSFSRARKLAKNYKKIMCIKGLIERYLKGDVTLCEKLKNFKIKDDRISILKLKRYMDIYISIFEKNLKNINSEDKQVVEEIYKKGKSVINYSIENYMCESKVYKSLKKFDLIFYYDISNVSRIINPLLTVSTYKKRRKKEKKYMNNSQACEEDINNKVIEKRADNKKLYSKDKC